MPTDRAAKATPAGKPGPQKTGHAGAHPPGASRARDLFDELIFVFVLVMFVKMFIVEIYKIPTGSMTPTLLGGTVAYVDWDGDGDRELFHWQNTGGIPEPPHLYVREDGRYLYAGRQPVPAEELRRWKDEKLIRTQSDRILVSKLPYLFREPERGEIVVFKVPPRIYDPNAPIFIKRVAGLPGDRLTFGPAGELEIDGSRVTQPAFYVQQRYEPEIVQSEPGLEKRPEIEYTPVPGGKLRIECIDVPEGEAYVFGDNALGSLDSRYWGGVPMPNIKGRAFMRILPLNQIEFLD